MTVRKKIKSGEIQALQLGGKGAAVRVDPAELERWLHGPSAAA